MKRSPILLLLMITIGLLAIATGQDPSESHQATDSVAAPSSVGEARSRAKLLHEMVRGTLQVMHRDFFDEDDPNAIPSASMEDVFHEMGRSYDVRLKWLVVETDVVNVDHQAEDEFEKKAVEALTRKAPYVEAVEGNRYRFAGPIPLASQCLKCHVKRRTSTETRTAGLLISMPMK